MAKQPTRESWVKTSITIRCPSCGTPHRVLVGLQDRPQAVKSEEEATIG